MNGNLIKYVRESKHIKRQWLADQLDIDETTLGKIENNQVNITVKRLIAISQILEVNICEFIENEHLNYRGKPADAENLLTKSAYLEFISEQKSLLEKQMKVLLDQNIFLTNVLEETNSVNKQLINLIGVSKAK